MRSPPEPGEPLRPDAPYYNVIRTTGGMRDADFEDVTLGPVEWDLALAGPEAIAAAARVGVPPVNADVLRVMEAARMLQVVACLALVPQLPVLAQGLAPMLDQWRAR